MPRRGERARRPSGRGGRFAPIQDPRLRRRRGFIEKRRSLRDVRLLGGWQLVPAAAEEAPYCGAEAGQGEQGDLPGLEQENSDYRKEAELLDRDDADQCRDSVGGDLVGRAVEI